MGLVDKNMKDKDIRRLIFVFLKMVIREINMAVQGWLTYYARGHMLTWLIKEFLPWLRRRIRQYMWKVWKTANSRKRHLRKAGVPDWQIGLITGWSSHSYWKTSILMGRLITNNMLVEYFGLKDFEHIYRDLHKKRMGRDFELDFNDYQCGQHESEQEAKLLMDSQLCFNW